MSNTLSIPFSCIIEGTRYRQKQNYGDVSGLADSFRSVGTLNPIGLNKRPPATPAEHKIAHEGFVYELVHGGRRYHTLKTRLKPTHLYHGSILDPEKLGFLFADEIPHDVKLEAELDENLHRLDMEWADAAVLIHDIHHAKRKMAQKSGKRWGLQQTGKLLNKAASNVMYAVQAGEAIRAGDKEILACKSLDEANSVFIKRNEDKALAELQQRNVAKLATQKNAIVAGTSSFLDHINISFVPEAPASSEQSALTGVLDLLTSKNGDSGAGGALRADSLLPSQRPPSANPERMAAPSSKASESPLSKPSAPSPVTPITIPLSRLFFLGDSVQGDDPVLKRFSDASVDHIVTDIPYGIDMDNLDTKHVADVSAEHDVEQNISMMPVFLSEAYRVIKPGGFCVFWYDLDHHEKLQAWATAAGFKVQRWPIIANKTSSCRNGAAAYNTTKNYEVAMYLRRSENSVLRRAVASSVRTYDFSAERKLYNNPFAKPFQLWKDIYEDVAFPGQTILDPYCGEMSACRAAINCGMTAMGIEKVSLHYHRGLDHIKAVYSLIHKSNVNFI